MKLALETAKKLMEANGGNLDLKCTQITELPDNLTVDGYLDLSDTPITELPNSLKVGGTLWLSFTPITELPENLTVGRSLFLHHTQITELPNNLTVGGSLDLKYTQIAKLPDNLTVGGGLDLSYTPIAELPDSLTIGRSLDLSHTPITELPDNLMVGGSLCLHHTLITELPDNLTVGGSLYLRNTPITELPDSLTVGGCVRTDNTKIPTSEKAKIRHLKDGDYVDGKYIYADGILTHIERAEKVGGYTFYHGKIQGRNVVSDGVNFAHCNSLQEGIADLKFKTAKNRGASQYEGLPLDTELSVPDAIAMYRVITGACKQGSEDFIRSLGQLKEKYTIRECIEITEGQYNAEAFAEFFGC